MIKPAAVILDMFGVIIKEHRGNFPGYIAARSPLPDAILYTDRAEYNKFYRPASAGEESSVKFLLRFGFDDPVAAAREYASDFITFDRGFIPFAERCRSEGIRLSLLSNDISLFSRSIRDIYGIEHYFTDTVVSSEVGLRKPDPAIYKLALERLGLDAGDCVFVDDQPKNLEAARDLGLRVMHFRRPTALAEGDFPFARDFAGLWAAISGETTPAREDELYDCARVIRESFATVADEFGLTCENCPTNGAFIDADRLRADRARGAEQFALRHFGGKIIGFAELFDRGGGCAEIGKLSVLPEYRHYGYGAALVEHCAERVKPRGGAKLNVGIIEENVRLKKWYASLGFVHTGTRVIAHLPFTVGYMEMESK